MRFRKVTVLLPIALALFVLSAREAAAEAQPVTDPADAAQTQLQDDTCGTGTYTEASLTAGAATPEAPAPAGKVPRVPDPIPSTPRLFVRRGGSLQPIPSGDNEFARPSVRPDGTNYFLSSLVRELRRRDRLNDNRGNTLALTRSADIISYDGTNRPDNGESHVYVIDISGECFRDMSIGGTWDYEGSPYCGTRFCARSMLDPDLTAGQPPSPQ